MASRVLALVAALVIGIGATGTAQETASAVAPRDVLTITVFGEPTMTGMFTVDLDGAIEFPLLGRVPVAGQTVRAVEIDLTKRLADGFLKNPQVSVDLEQTARGRVFVTGEVRAPGTYQVTSDATLIEVLAMAGSTNPGASKEILILRPRTGSGSAPIVPPSGATVDAASEPDADIIRVDLRDLQTGGLLRNNVAIHDGDTIFVPKAQLVYITGQVRIPGAYAIEPGTTVLQALSLAGGVTDRGAASRVRVVRIVDGESKTISIKPADPVEPGDTLVVPERFF
jgi:polysaccharide export outer membrane protein